ncbi:hypothetical protein [Streptomyces sp. NPDC060022]|uniref:hypothetical protein n=1 Tax=Streptomyces sp. NPDC060022 TaxID=3347039 RepID=UPI0036CB8EFA
MSSSTVPAAGAAAAMLLVGTSTAVSAKIAEYPVLSGQGYATHLPRRSSSPSYAISAYPAPA